MKGGAMMKQLLAELFENYYKDIYTYLFSLCHDASLSEDLASEVFLEVVRSISTFRGQSDIKTCRFLPFIYAYHLRRAMVKSQVLISDCPRKVEMDLTTSKNASEAKSSEREAS